MKTLLRRPRATAYNLRVISPITKMIVGSYTNRRRFPLWDMNFRIVECMVQACLGAG